MRLSRLLPLIFLFVFYDSPLPAQNNLNVTVSAKVSSSIELVTIQSMQLSAEDAQNGVITINPTSSANAGKLIAIGSINTDIRISYLSRRELTNTEANNTLVFNYNLAGNHIDDQSTAELLDSDNKNFELNEEGRFYIWIGGSIDISNALPGNYQGEFTLEIEYI